MNLPGEHLELIPSVKFEAPPEGRVMFAGSKLASTHPGMPETWKVNTSESPMKDATMTAAEVVDPLAACAGLGNTDTVRLPCIRVRVTLRAIETSLPWMVMLNASEGHAASTNSVRTVVLDSPCMSFRGLGGLKL